MFALIKKWFFTGITFLSVLASINPLKCISMTNQDCKLRPEFDNINSDEPTFYPYSVKVNKCSGSCNNINDP